MSNDERRDQYTTFFGLEPTDSGALDGLERSLGIDLPEDFKRIATFYSGGMVGGVSHHAIALSGAATNVFGETKRLRGSRDVRLPRSFVVLAEPPESLIVMDTAAANGAPAVIWLNANDAPRLADFPSVNDPQIWVSYADFFDFLLQREAEERTVDK